MTSGAFFRIRRPQVVADEMEGEVIAINLDDGAYWSFRESASIVWQRLLRGAARLEQIVDELCAHYEGDRDAIEAAASAFLVEIESEGLIQADGPPDEGEADAGLARPARRAPFVEPVFEKHTDMQEFLLVDPIHEVDVEDWPTRRTRDP